LRAAKLREAQSAKKSPTPEGTDPEAPHEAPAHRTAQHKSEDLDDPQQETEEEPQTSQKPKMTARKKAGIATGLIAAGGALGAGATLGTLEALKASGTNTIFTPTNNPSEAPAATETPTAEEPPPNSPPPPGIAKGPGSLL
jgi:hypothetical protein